MAPTLDTPRDDFTKLVVVVVAPGNRGVFAFARMTEANVGPG